MNQSITSTTERVVATLEITHKAGGFKQREYMLDWISSCLNCNTNHVAVVAEELRDASSVQAAGVPVHFLRAENEDGESLDLIVGAPNRDAAIEIWRCHYQLGPTSSPEWSGVLPGVTAAVVGSLNWDHIRSTPDVTTAQPAAAPAASLDELTDTQLLDELRRRVR